MNACVIHLVSGCDAVKGPGEDSDLGWNELLLLCGGHPNPTL